MTLYRVVYHHEGGTSRGYGWHTSRRAADAAAAEFRRRTKDEDGDASVQRIDAPLSTRTAIVAFLNHYAAYPDNG